MPDPRHTLRAVAGRLGLPESAVRYYRDLFEAWLLALVLEGERERRTEAELETGRGGFRRRMLRREDDAS